MQEQTIEGFPLSPQQHRLWVLQRGKQYLPYRAHCSIFIDGSLDISLLKAAVAQVIQQHEILRTAFVSLPGVDLPLQVVRDAALPDFQMHDLSGVAQVEQAARLEMLVAEARQVSFDFEQSPLLYVALARLSASRYRLLLSLPALCADVVTLKEIMAEIARCYAAYTHEEEAADQPLQYVDLAAWQNELLEAADTGAGREYWLKQDFSGSEVQQLPFTNISAGTLDTEFKPDTIAWQVKPEVAARITALAGRRGFCPRLSHWRAGRSCSRV